MVRDIWTGSAAIFGRHEGAEEFFRGCTGVSFLQENDSDVLAKMMLSDLKKESFEIDNLELVRRMKSHPSLHEIVLHEK